MSESTNKWFYVLITFDLHFEEELKNDENNVRKEIYKEFKTKSLPNGARIFPNCITSEDSLTETEIRLPETTITTYFSSSDEKSATQYVAIEARKVFKAIRKRHADEKFDGDISKTFKADKILVKASQEEGLLFSLDGDILDFKGKKV